MISVIVPIYNTASFIERCVNSILSQSFNNIEIILVNDGSVDNSEMICRSLSVNNKKIKYYYKDNGGAASARKYGVEQAMGEWITFVDSDDTLPPDALKNLIQYITEDYDIIVGTLLKQGRPFQHKIETTILDNDKYLEAILLRKTSVGPVAKLFRKTLFENIIWETPKEVYQNEDLLMLLKLAVVSKKIYINKQDICYNYIYRKDSASKSGIMPFNNWIILFNLISNTLGNLLQNKSLGQAFMKYRLYCVILMIRSGCYFETNNAYIQNLIEGSKDYVLDRADKKIVFYMKHKYCRYVIANVHRTKNTIKQVLKHILKYE